MAKNRISELKAQEHQRQREEIIMNQAKEREEVEQAHVMEYQDFNKQWDDILMQEEQKNADAIRELEMRHVHQLEENRSELEKRLPLHFKHSSELLNMKQIQIRLAQQKEYAEAHKVQIQGQELLKAEEEKYL